MKKIRVLQLVPMLGPGGAERVVVHIARGLNRQRFDVAVLSIWHRVGSDLEQLLDDSEVGVWYLGKSSGFDGRMYHRLHHVLKEYSPDILHSHLHALRYALPSLMFLNSVSCLHTVHNLAEHEIEPRARYIQRYALTHGVTPVAVSSEVAKSVEQCYGIQNCHIISNGIPTADYGTPQISRGAWRAREGFKEDEILFVCVARFAPQKNHALLLEAFSRGPAGDPRTHLILIGEGELRGRLIDQAKSLRLDDKIHFLGLRTDIADVLNAMDVFALSSDWEGNPLSVMEAMAAGLPVISTAVGGVPGLITSGKEGLLVQQEDVEGLSRAMTGLLSVVTRQVMGSAAKQRASQDFDVYKMIHDYEQLYEDLHKRSYRLKTKKLSQPQNLFLKEA